MHAGMAQQRQQARAGTLNRCGVSELELGEERYTGEVDPVASIEERRISSGPSKLVLVGARGFEPPTPASRTQCATGLRYAPTKSREPEREEGLSYIKGSKRKPWASATPR